MRSSWGNPLVDLAAGGTAAAAFLHERGLDPDAPPWRCCRGVAGTSWSDRPDPGRDAPLIRARVPRVQFVVACAPNLPDPMFAPLVDEESQSEVVLVRDRTDDVLAASDMVVTASGTATIQCTLHRKPMVVVYRLSPLTYRLGKPFLHVDTYAMPNLVAGTRIVPELIQDDFTAERTAAEAVKFLTDLVLYEDTCRSLTQVCEHAGQPGASGRAADAVRGRRHWILVRIRGLE